MSFADVIDLKTEFIRERPRLEWYIVRRVRCRQTAADLASDMFMKLQRLCPAIYSHGEARTYLYRMANSIAIDHIRVTKRRSEILEAAGDQFQPSTDPGPEPAALARDEMRIVERALGELPEKSREMLMLSRLHGMTHGEIAEQMGVSKSLVEKYIVRAILHCRQRLHEASAAEILAADRRTARAND